MAERFIAITLLLLPLLVLVACQAPPPAPVAELEQPPTEKILHHYVSRGETLYSIAWRYELDFVRLAAVNGLERPYTLHPGQRLSLDMSKTPPKPARPSRPSVRTGVIDTRPAVSGGSLPPKVEIPPQPTLPSSGWHWQWPVQGRVSKEYDAGRVLKGISIYSDPGVQVKVAAPGVVVYAGEGLRGYGKLIIVKHSEKYLSAYAHNRKILVDENQSLGRGAAISEVGVDGTNRNRLYFEIRENGKPVDPLKLLPRQ